MKSRSVSKWLGQYGWLVSGALGVVLLAVAFGLVEPSSAILPVPEHQLGLVRDHAVLAEPVVAASVPFQIVGGDGEDNTKKNVRLWESVLKVRGQHLENYPQQIGDCVSFGCKNALEYLQCVQLANPHPRGDHDVAASPARFRPVFPPYFYGVSRHQIGGDKIRGDGSVGAWAAEGAASYGVLNSDHGNCPPYSAKIASEWGRVGPPEWAIQEGKKRLVKTVSPVKSASAACDAITNGYPVTIASSFGTTAIRQQDGRQVARWNSTWYHQMCLIAYDGSSASGKRYFYCLNSWGPKSHPDPSQGEPPGGFWLSWEDVDKITKQGDSWAFSAFDGFPAQSIDFSVFGAADGPRGPMRNGDGGGVAMESVDLLAGYLLPNEAFLPMASIGVLMLVVSVGLYVGRLLRGNDRRRMVAAGLLAVILQAGLVDPVQAQQPVISPPPVVDQAPAGVKSPMDFSAFGVHDLPMVQMDRPVATNKEPRANTVSRTTSNRETKSNPVAAGEVNFAAFGVDAFGNAPVGRHVKPTDKADGVTFSAWGCVDDVAIAPPVQMDSSGMPKKVAATREPQCLVFWRLGCSDCLKEVAYLKKDITKLGWIVSEDDSADFRLIDTQAASSAELLVKHGIQFVPQMVYLDQSGKETKRVVGFSGPQNVTSELIRLRKK